MDPRYCRIVRNSGVDNNPMSVFKNKYTNNTKISNILFYNEKWKRVLFYFLWQVFFSFSKDMYEKFCKIIDK